MGSHSCLTREPLHGKLNQEVEFCSKNLLPIGKHYEYQGHFQSVFAKQVYLILLKGPFKYYVIKEVGVWGQKMAIFDDLQNCKSSKRYVGGPKKVIHIMT